MGRKVEIKVAIIGGRNVTDFIDESRAKKLIHHFLDLLYTINKYEKVIIVSGGAKGADSIAGEYARENDIELIEYLPDWKRYGKRAGFVRNHDIINTCDIVLAIWDTESKGTKHSIELALKQNKPIFLANLKIKRLSKLTRKKFDNITRKTFNNITIYTSYVANIKNLPDNLFPILITRGGKNINLPRYEKLAPTWELIKLAKNGHTEKYTELFNEYLGTLDVDIILKELQALSKEKDIVLICFEKPSDFCHRHLVAKWLSNHIDMQVKEI